MYKYAYKYMKNLCFRLQTTYFLLISKIIGAMVPDHAGDTNQRNSNNTDRSCESRHWNCGHGKEPRFSFQNVFTLP